MTSRSSTLTLVVVDDDEHVRRAMSRLLRSHGHNVELFASAEAYLERYCLADCAILDIDLPGITGLELVTRLSQRGRRRVPVVFVTAHDELATLTEREEAERPLLRKPLDETGLLEAIAQAMNGPA